MTGGLCLNLEKYLLRDTWSSDQKKVKFIFLIFNQKDMCAITANVGIFCEQEAHTPHRSPKKHFKSINAFVQRFYYTITYNVYPF